MAGETIVIGIVLLCAGAFGVFAGIARRRPHELITETPTTEVGSLSDTGIVELKGTATTADVGDEQSTFTSPISERDDTLLAAWSVQEWDERGDRSHWRTVGSGVWSVPFALDDGTGEVVVDAGDHADRRGWLGSVTNIKASDGVSFDDVMCEFERFPVAREVGVDETPPPNIRNFVAQERAVDTQSGSITNVVDIGKAHGDRRYYEQTIGVGDEVYVLGHAYPRTPDAPRPLRPERMVVTEPQEGDDGMLIVSDQREQDLVKQTQWHRAFLALGGLGVLAGGGLAAAGLGAI